MVEVGRAQGEFGGFDPSAVETRCCPGAQPPDTAIARTAAPIHTHQRRRTRDNVRSKGYLSVVMSPLLSPVRKVLAPRASLTRSRWLRCADSAPRFPSNRDGRDNVLVRRSNLALHIHRSLNRNVGIVILACDTRPCAVTRSCQRFASRSVPWPSHWRGSRRLH